MEALLRLQGNLTQAELESILRVLKKDQELKIKDQFRIRSRSATRLISRSESRSSIQNSDYTPPINKYTNLMYNTRSNEKRGSVSSLSSWNNSESRLIGYDCHVRNRLLRFHVELDLRQRRV
ncbi:hypothetical protein Ciccas_007110 [Cichlidogyrus casuarinus]|uniref:Uncharacterized protein n=1 Tax=Cichlidogyrus casuarinus TaxID=1844966 RepID=A0ABD2Q3Y3_9PLAT